MFPLVIATYSSAAYGRSPWITLAILVVLVPLRDLNDPYIQTIGDALFTSSLSVLSLLAGVEGRMIRNRSLRLDERQLTLERDEERLAALAAEEERRRIARELHDIVAHGLGVMVLQAGAAEQVLEHDTDSARHALGVIRSTGQDAINQMGTLLGLVRSPAESSLHPQPTLDSIPELVGRMRASGLDVTIDMRVENEHLTPALQLSVFRVVQEGLTNALKHAGSARVHLSIRRERGALEVEISDDGRAVGAGRGSRRGLAGIAERVEVFGGTFSAGPAPTGGWRIFASFPVPE